MEKLNFLYKPDSIVDICQSALYCYLQFLHTSFQQCYNFCQSESCKQIIEKACPDKFYIPNAPLLFGHIYLAHTKEYVFKPMERYEPEYICYNKQLCDGFNFNETFDLFNNTTCRRYRDFSFKLVYEPNDFSHVQLTITENLSKCNTILRNDSKFCNESIMYQCKNSSKCIAPIRLFDDKRDCDYGDDEIWFSTDHNYSIINSRTHVNCTMTNRWISRKFFYDVNCDCGYDIYNLCDDEPSDWDDIRKDITFPKICNNIDELKPITIGNRNETDETGCDQWPCNNIYTRCNGILDCFNGTDEVDCYPSSLANCSLNSFLCLSSETAEYMCLYIDKINDGNIDCLGAIDEPYIYRNYIPRSKGRFCCNSTSDILCLNRLSLCNGIRYCLQEEDEKFCHHIRKSSSFSQFDICDSEDISNLTDVEVHLCYLFKDYFKPSTTYFSLDRQRKSSKQITKSDTNLVYTSSSTNEITRPSEHRCHRSISLRVWLDNEKNLTTITCLCPPNYYGSRCQYQNERVSLTIEFRAYSDSWQTSFIIVISLIDDSDQRTIHSYDQFTYIPVPNCKTKYNTDLLYSTRPKNQSKNYSIHIDIYEKFSLLYRGSLLRPLSFAFLPVRRLAMQLYIPHTAYNFKSCSDNQCVHGHCIRYFNDSKHSTFCQCNSGWSGRFCTIPYNCTCTSDSLCVGILTNNRSICVCPINKWGRRCLLDNHICQSSLTCYNGGKCIPIVSYGVSDKKFICICPKDFYGETCEIPQNKIILSFEKDIILPQLMIIHFIEVKDNAPPENGTTLKRIPVDRKSITIYWSRPFHIVFVEFIPHNDNYYLIIVQNVHNQSKTIETTLKSSNRCPNVQEEFNESFSHLHLIDRIKLYHVPCQQQSPQLSCFYDDVHMCLCNDFEHQRQANCFKFNYMLKRNCHGRSNCEHGAQCLQDNVLCPETSVCVCPRCYYGARCQHSVTEFSLSLDAILGEHIQPHVNIIYQPVIVKISITLTILMTVMGFINGIFSMMTFMNKGARKTGCGSYLLGSSITSLLVSIIFCVKFSILLAAQMTYMTNQSFLYFQCRSIDFILRIGLNMDQWLNACVSSERAISAMKGITFDKNKSKRIAKFIIVALLFLTIGTNIHEITSRRLVDDDNNDEKRISCVVTYSVDVQKYNLSVNIFHFCTPFVINLLSAIIIVIKTARLRATAKMQQNYREVLLNQFKAHKHLLITPLLLVILAIPRLIISFISGCMQTSADAWLFLVGYFISFIPPILTFFIFVVPSETYKEEFYNTFKRY